jgi:hypothetical protein
MSSAHKAIYHKLSTTDDITEIVGTSIVPQYRENLIPCVEYRCQLVEENRSYEDILFGEYEVTLSCVAHSLADADELAAAVTTALDRQDWEVGSEVRAMGCWIEDKETDQVELGTRNVRAWVVELKAKLLVEGL